jgi:replication-associated recombination protein RarA
MPKKIKLPKNKLIVIPNADKSFHEAWYEGRNLGNIPHPFRMCIVGPPNTGKTSIIKNLILRTRPKFEEVILLHPDANYTREYDDLGASLKKLDSFLSPQEWEGKVKTLLIVDDIEFNNLSKSQKSHLNRAMGYVSTHKKMSIVITSQNPFDIPVCVRRCSNFFVFFKMDDLDAVATVARKTGITRKQFTELFKLCPVPHDSIWIDRTDHSPAPLRKNCYQVIVREDDIL